MKVLVTGSHGLVGTELIRLLTEQGHTTARLVRSQPASGDVLWDPRRGQIDKAGLEGFDAVVHLAGDNIAGGRWTSAKKAAIRDSRVDGTTLLSEALASLQKAPEVLVSSSAIGYYGDRGTEVLTEKSSAGAGFLADVCRDWEAASEAAQHKGIRVAKLRTGVVLSKNGGALTLMLPPFQLGAGGRLGSGKQFMSWIALDELAGIIHHILIDKTLSGPVNAVSPDPVTNEQFTAALGTALHRPTIFPVPAFAAHLLLGDMADELLLSSQRVQPEKLLASRYTFQHPELLPMLQQVLGAK